MIDREKLAEEVDEGLLFLDPKTFDAAIIGIGSRCGQPELVAYDVDKIIEVLMEDGMEHGEAWEFFDFNVVGAWVGKRTPIFIYKVDHETTMGE